MERTIAQASNATQITANSNGTAKASGRAIDRPSVRPGPAKLATVRPYSGTARRIRTWTCTQYPPVPDLDREPEQGERQRDDDERDEDPEGRLLVVEDGEDAEQADLHGGEEVHAVVEQPLLVHTVLPEAIDLVRRGPGLGRVGCGGHGGGPLGGDVAVLMDRVARRAGSSAT